MGYYSELIVSWQVRRYVTLVARCRQWSAVWIGGIQFSSSHPVIVPSKYDHTLHFLCSWTWCSWIRASWYNYENNQQDALYRLIYYSKSVLYVWGDVFVHHQEHLTVFTVSGSVHPSCCRLVSRIPDTSRQQFGWTLPDTVNTVKCSWWWTKTSPETYRADLE